MLIVRLPFAVFLLSLLFGCKTETHRAPAIGEAYAGPATLVLRQEIAPRSPAVATVKHGERLEIVQRRRRFLKLRNAEGAEGWADERMLLNSAEVSALRQLAERSKSLPSQGTALSYEALNVHTEPQRQSPSFLVVKEKEKVEVIGRRITPRSSPPRKPLVVAPSPTARKRGKKKEKAEPTIPPPPMPPAPKPPENWEELSRSTLETEPETAAERDDPAPVPTDDWTLLRTASGQCGWVLTRRLNMAIPDDVAQYAEGRRISSYFALGQTQDGDQAKNNWLWTTSSQGLKDYDFDSFRVFIWSLRRHRYETAYIERNLKGFYPTLRHPVDFAAPGSKREPAMTKYPGFSVCVEKRDGARARRSYALLGNIVRFAGEQPCDPGAPLGELTAKPGFPNTPETPAADGKGSSASRIRAWFGNLKRKWLGSESGKRRQ